jgi:hypothetical protein
MVYCVLGSGMGYCGRCGVGKKCRDDMKCYVDIKCLADMECYVNVKYCVGIKCYIDIELRWSIRSCFLSIFLVEMYFHSRGRRNSSQSGASLIFALYLLPGYTLVFYIKRNIAELFIYRKKSRNCRF